ncbi:hypothetical protein FB451DRAFT_1446646 [Mycena latifolia]|nr:hypothetical protein FB451DRAFT_1446646 [Mycena latifolia]
MGSRVPNELWLEIFDHLPLDTIECLSLTSRTFSPLTRPFLFAHFDFHPYASRMVNGVFALPSAEEVEQSLERLAFWASPEIAPFVRSCDITPWASMGAARTRAFSGTTTPYVLLAPFFDLLPCFTHMHRLHAKLVYFTQTGVTNLLRLPALASLHIDACGIAPGAHIDVSSLPLERV